jgi:predicted permease
MQPFSTVWQDIRYSVRMLRLSPGFTAVAVASLALGIGANTAIFSLIDTILLKWLPVESPQQLVVIARNPKDPNPGFAYPDYEYFRDHSQSYSGVVAFSGGFGQVGFTTGGNSSQGAQLVSVALTSGNYFRVLGVKPALGRMLNDEDNKGEGAHPYAVLGYNFWKSKFGGDSAAIGKEFRLNGSPFTVIGVAGEGFTGTDVGSAPDLYVPIMMIRQVNRGVREWNTRHFWWLSVIGRMKPGATVPKAAAEATVLFERIVNADPEHKPDPSWDKQAYLQRQGVILPGGQGYSWFRNRVSKPLFVLMVVVALVLLIACANVANLLLARAAGRQREIAIRLAIGASRGRLVSQMLTESVVLSLLGGLAGIGFALFSVRVLMRFMPGNSFPITLDLSPDWRLVGFCVGVSICTGILFGLIPALKATKPNLTPSLKGDVSFGFRRLDARKVLVVLQVAVSLLLLIGTGLLVRSLGNLRSLDPGFRRDNFLMVQVDPSQSGYKSQRLRDFYDRLRDGAQHVPGVRVASLAMITPLGGSEWTSGVGIQGRDWKPNEDPSIDMNAVSPRYFETAGIPILLGRDFTDRDSPAQTPDPPEHQPSKPTPPDTSGPPHVAIINQTMARRFWPNEGAIGKRFSMGDDSKFKMEGSYEVVGVVGDTRYFGLRNKLVSMIYVPNWRNGADGRTLCLRTSSDPKLLAESIRNEVRKLDPAVPMLQARSMEETLDDELSQERLIATLCTFFGGLALLLASVGLYGLIAYAVTRRTREIGIRMAIGAQRSQVLWLMLRDLLALVVCGALIGIPVALGVTRLLETFLFGVQARDPMVITLATGLLLSVTAAAGYLPARRASRVDPMVALRYE